jgi:hypothetical protein
MARERIVLTLLNKLAGDATRLGPDKAGPGLRLNEHLEHEDGEVGFRHACSSRASRSRNSSPTFKHVMRTDW